MFTTRSELASKALELPAGTMQKQTSKKLLHEIKGFITAFVKTIERANLTMELSRKAGFKDLEIGNFVAQAMKEEDYSAMSGDPFESFLDNKL
ncbi:MAG: hypothetical protein ACRD5E_08585 [Nitrososphaeraceae archaeon]